MIINMGDEKISICCYEMMDQLLYQGINPDWGYCPFCNKTIIYIIDEE